MFAIFLLVVAGCGGSTNAQSAQVCSAITGLGGNRDDFKTILTTDRVEDAYAAIDRVSQRTQAAINALKEVNDGPIAVEAEKLAVLEEGLLPILDQFRAVSDQASWTAAGEAYTRWYNQSISVIADVAPRLADLGVHCAPA